MPVGGAGDASRLGEVAAQQQDQVQAQGEKALAQATSRQDAMQAKAEQNAKFAKQEQTNMAKKQTSLKGQLENTRKVKTNKQKSKQKNKKPQDEIKKHAQQRASEWSGSGSGRRSKEELEETLIALANNVSDGMPRDAIRKQVNSLFPGNVLAQDRALEFLSEVTEGSLANEVEEGRVAHNEEHGVEIEKKANIVKLTVEFSKEGLGTPAEAEELFTQVMSFDKDAKLLIGELIRKFGKERFNQVLDMLLHRGGETVKDPNIDRTALQQANIMIQNLRVGVQTRGIARIMHQRAGKMVRMDQQAQLRRGAAS